MSQAAQYLASGIAQGDPLLIGLVCLSLGAAIGLVISLSALMAIALGCLEHESRVGRIVRSVLFLGAVAASIPGHVSAQTIDADPIPVLEPELSKLYGSETLDFGSLFVSAAISPDGRWLVYSRAEVTGLDDAQMNLWLVSLEGAEEPRRVTTGAHGEASPVWFPSGDRIAFRSTRPSPDGNFQYLMTIRIDPETGQPVGPPRQISLEPGPFTRAHAVSPDGRWLAYVRRPKGGSRTGYALTVLPESGGTARVLVEQPEALYYPSWSTDGHIYFLSEFAAGDEDAIHPGMHVKRVTAVGGAPEVVSSWPGVGRAGISADARYIIYRTTPRSSEQKDYEIGTVEGRRLGSFSLPEDMDLITYTSAKGTEFLAISQEVAAPLTVLPVDGGSARQLTETRAYDWPLGWTSNGSAIVFESQLDGRNVILVAPLDGGAMRQLRRPDEDWVYGPVLSHDQKYVLYGRTEDDPDSLILRIMDVESGESRLLTRTPWSKFTYYNDSRVEDRFVYAEREDGRFEYWSVHPEGQPVLLRSFPDSVFPPIIGLLGDRLAYWEATETVSTLFLATAGEAEALPVVTVPGRVGQRGSNPPVWSPDGRYLATGYWRSETNEIDALLVELSSTGQVVGQPRTLENLPSSWWGLGWLPTSDGFLVIDGDVWLVPLDPQSSAIKLTDEETWPTWTYSLSPDGRRIAVAPEVRRGGAFWRLDFTTSLAETERRQ